MPDTNDSATLAIAAASSAPITDVVGGDCIPLVRVITVGYRNATTANAVLSVSCGGAGVTPSSFTVGPGSGSRQFTLTHTSAGMGHTINSLLMQGTIRLGGDSVSVNVGNPCPLSIDGLPVAPGYLPPVARAAALTGTFDTTVGNKIMLLVEDPVEIVNGTVQHSRLTFVDPAVVKAEAGAKKGLWSHPAIPSAKKGQHLRVVLTRDGEVKSIIRAVFQ